MSAVKVFIAQPMRYKSDTEIIMERHEIVDKIHNEVFRDQDVEILNSYMDEFTASNVKNKSLYFLGRSIQLLSEADVVYFAKGWQGARGCNIEHQCAKLYDLKIIED